LLAGAFLLVPAVVLGQSFEGIVTQRTVEIKDDPLYRLMFRLQPRDQEMDYDPEKEWTVEDDLRELEKDAERLMALSVDEIRGAVEPQDEQLGDANVSETRMLLKGSMVRMEPGGPAYFLLNLGTGETTIVNTYGKYYIKWSAEELERMAGESNLGAGDEDAGAGEAKPARIEPVGATKEINGLRAEAFRVRTENTITMGWVTDEHGDLRASFEKVADRFGLQGSEDEPGSDAEDLLWEKGVPVLIKTFSLDVGDDEARARAYEVSEIVSIERKSLPADLFKVPAGYTRKTVEELYGQN
jgi:hypothetical protein